MPASNHNRNLHLAPTETDPIVLAKDLAIDGGIGSRLPNYNVMVVGCSGTGKSLSVCYPTMYKAKNVSMIATFPKEGEGKEMAAERQSCGYQTPICNLVHPEESDLFFDPLKYVSSQSEIEQLAYSDVRGAIEKTVEEYWQNKAAPLWGALLEATMMKHKNPSLADALDLFDRLTLDERGYGITTGLDSFFARLKERVPNSYAVREFYNFRSLPVRTASCVRDTLAACLSTIYPSSLRDAMRTKETIDFRQLAREKTALFIITSPVNTSLNAFANKIYSTAIKELLAYAAECPNYRLPREVRLIFDDFAVGSKITDFASQVSIFRSAGLSTLILLQSESQLFSLYGEKDAQSIINNMATYCYFSGGMDLVTCEHVARRVNKSLDSVLYSPMDKIYVMQAGRKPIISTRYPILEDPQYQAMKQRSHARRGPARAG